jgi:Beta-propeller repeat
VRSYFLALPFCAGFSALAATPAAPALVYSTYLRDSFTPTAIATDAAGNIYLAGSALVDPGNYLTTGLVVKLNPQGTQYLYVRYWGGSVRDAVNAMAVDSAGDVYIVGDTLSPDFPVTEVRTSARPPATATSGPSSRSSTRTGWWSTPASWEDRPISTRRRLPLPRRGSRL